MSKRIAIMQPYLFPYIGYWQLLHAADKFIVLDDVNYIKKGWINRNRILVNDSDYLFTMPVKNASQNRLISEIEVDDTGKWKCKFLKTIEQSYKNAEYFNHAAVLIESCLTFKSNNLSALLVNSIQNICIYLGIETKIACTSAVYNTSELKKDEKIISICLQESAQEYINPFGGMQLYDKEKFAVNDIRLKFLESAPIFYKQGENDFIPNLSIIDIMMFNSRESIRGMLDSYKLV